MDTPASEHCDRYTILFVDDEEKSCKYFSKAYSKDFQILTAQNASEAENILEKQGAQIAVLITDQRMPAQTGLELLKCVRFRYPHIIRMLTTAYADLDDTIEAVNQAEIFRYVSKPWNLPALRTDLLAAIETFLARRRAQDRLEEQRRATLSVAGTIAHELRTPLAGIRAGALALQKYLPVLLDSHERDIRNGGAVKPIRTGHRRALTELPQRIQHEVNQASIVIDLLLATVREQHLDLDEFQLLSARHCVEDALFRYPFHRGDEALIQAPAGADFHFFGIGALFTFVLFNLLKNALRAIGTADKGEISIVLEPGTSRHRLRFRDTGTGIAPDVLPHIFEEFFTHWGGGKGNGIGLAFCRRVVTSFGGTIACESKLGEYTEFVIELPAARTN